MSCTSPNCAVDTCDLATLPEHVRNSSTLVRHGGDHDSYVSRVRSWIVKTFPFLETVFHEIGQLFRLVQILKSPSVKLTHQKIKIVYIVTCGRKGFDSI